MLVYIYNSKINMWWLSLLLLFLTTFHNSYVYGKIDYCYTNDKEFPQKYHFTSKTSYQSVVGNLSDFRFDNIDISDECKPIKLWLLCRPGASYPDYNLIQRNISPNNNSLSGIKNEHRRHLKQGQLCPLDSRNIRRWQWNPNITTDKANSLTENGKEDLEMLGKRFMARFPALFDPKTSGSVGAISTAFYSLNTSNTNESSDVLSQTLSGSVSTKIFLSKAQLAPDQSCYLHKILHTQNESNPESEVYKFETSDLLNRTIAKIASKLGFPSLNNKNVYLMWDMCRYELSWEPNKKSPWCALFSPNDAKVLEYREDLISYYKYGHGHEMNKGMACYMVQEMFRRIGLIGKIQDDKQLYVYLTDYALIQFFLVALDVLKDDEPLTIDNFKKMENRKWRTSSISPIMANIAVIKYECPPGSDNDPFVQFLLNEKPLQIEGCNNGLCEWEHLKTKYEQLLLNNCQDLYCISSATKLTVSYILSLLLILYQSHRLIM